MMPAHDLHPLAAHRPSSQPRSSGRTGSMRLKSGLFKAGAPRPRVTNETDRLDAGEGSLAASKVLKEGPPLESSTPTATPTPEDDTTIAPNLAIAVPPPLNSKGEAPSSRRRKAPSRSAMPTGTRPTLWPWRRTGHVRTASGRLTSGGTRERAGSSDGLDEERSVRANDLIGEGLYGAGIDPGSNEAITDTESKERGHRSHSDNTKGRTGRRSLGRRSSGRDKVWVTTAEEVAAAMGTEETRRRRQRGSSSPVEAVSPPDSRRHFSGPLRRAHSSSSLTGSAVGRPPCENAITPNSSKGGVEPKGGDWEGFGTEDDTDYDEDDFEDSWMTLRPRYCGQQEFESDEDSTTPADRQFEGWARNTSATSADVTARGEGKARAGDGQVRKSTGRSDRLERKPRRPPPDPSDAAPAECMAVGPNVAGSGAGERRKVEPKAAKPYEEEPPPAYVREGERSRKFSATTGFFSKENGTEEMGQLLENEDMRAAFRQVSPRLGNPGWFFMRSWLHPVGS